MTSWHRRLARTIAGETLLAGTDLLERQVRRAKPQDRPDPVPVRLVVEPPRVRDSSLHVSVGPYAPQLIRLNLNPQSLGRSWMVRSDLELKRVSRHRESHARILADLVQARRRIRTDPVCRRPRCIQRPRVSAAAWLDSRETGS